MDELFLLPDTLVAMPRAYWMDQPFLSSQLVVISPSSTEWNRVDQAAKDHDRNDYDMDILNRLYGNTSMVLPHRKYDLLTGEFRGSEHARYLGSDTEIWNPRKALKEAKFLHFSDWPMPKPWIHSSEALLEQYQPDCKADPGGNHDCGDREVWLETRKDFADRREVW
jgi:hypothetical protein